MELLDLQQKEETLREAQYSNQQASAAREQVDETAAQSQIFFLFTVVTIIFVCRSHVRWRPMWIYYANVWGVVATVVLYFVLWYER